MKNIIFRVWSTEHINDSLKWAKEKKYGFGVKEKCLMTIDGDYIGIETGKPYSKNSHYHSDTFTAQILKPDEENKTGMYHLYKEINKNNEENNKSWKERFIGAIVTVNEAHYAGEHKIYFCHELEEYFSNNELKILSHEN